MLDKKSLSLLHVLYRKDFARFNIYSKADLIKEFPKNGTLSMAELDKCIKILCDGEYITVKYEDDEEVCLSLLGKGRYLFERKGEEKFRPFLSSFFGAVLGATLSAIIFLLLFFGGKK